MGAVAKVVRRVVRAIAPKPKISQPKPQTPKPAKPSAPQTQNKKAAAAAGSSTAGTSMYGGSTMMTGASGVQEEANVAKTMLGGVSDVSGKKKKNTGMA